MTTETQAQAPSLEARMAGMEAQQEIIIELLRSQDANFRAMDAKSEAKFAEMNAKFEAKFAEMDAKSEAKFAEMNERMVRIEAQQEIIVELLKIYDAKFDAINHRLFIALVSLFTIIGAGVVTYVVNLLT